MEREYGQGVSRGKMNGSVIKNTSDRLYRFIISHPYLSAFIACASLIGINISSRARIPIIFIIISVISLIFLCITSVLLIIRTPKEKKLLVFVILCGFFIRIVYILSTNVLNWQHDVAGFTDEYRGHGAYIYHLYNGSFPKIDTSDTGQFYHPPLHHIIAALWVRVQTILQFGFNSACENIQLLSAFYSCACMITSYKIARVIGMKYSAACICVSLVALHPSFFMLASSVNNDILSVSLMFTALLWALRWYNSQSLSSIIMTAVSVGGAMMAKLSGAYVAFPIAFLFAVSLVIALTKKHNTSLPTLLKQYSVFAVICIPLGLWWQIRSNILYGLPLTYVPRLDGIKFLDISGHTVFERLFDLSNFSTPFTQSGWYVYNEGVTLDWNIPLAMFKTSLFGEYTLGQKSAVCTFLAWMLFTISVILAAICFVLMIFVTVRSLYKKCKKSIYDIAFVIFYAVTVALYVKFCFDYPQNCTMDFRYIVPTLLVSGIFLGRYNEYGNKYIKLSANAVCAAFCVSSALFYVLGVISSI